MGFKLSAPQREIYSQVVGTLMVGGKKLSKGLVKRFIRWLFASFPQVSPKRVRDIKFWNEVGAKMSSLRASGDKAATEYYPLLLLICESLSPRGRDAKRPRCAS